MNIHIVPQDVDFIQEVVSQLEIDGLDYSSYIVVFPGNRPAHFLRRAIARAVKTSFIPPSVFSMDGFIDFLFENKLGNRKKIVAPLDAIAILYDIHMSFGDKDRLGGDEFISLERFFSLGTKVLRDLEDLAINGISGNAFKEALEQLDIPAPSHSLLDSLLLYFENFYERLGSLNFSTRASRYQDVSSMIDNVHLAAHKMIIFAGFFALTKFEKTFFKKLSSLKKVLFMFQEGKGLKEMLEDLDVPHVGEESAKKGPSVFFYSSKDIHGQVLGLREILKIKLDTSAMLDESNVIVMPSSETLFPLIHHTLSLMQGESYNISIGYPLVRTTIYTFLEVLMKVLSSMDNDRIYLPDYIKFILHPHIKNIGSDRTDSETTRILFHSIENTLIRKSLRVFMSLKEIEDVIHDSKVGSYKGNLWEHLMDIHENTIVKLQSLNTIGDFASKMMGVLAYISERNTALLHSFFISFIQEFFKILEEISSSRLKENKFINNESYFNFFRDYVATCRVNFKGTPLKGLQVLDFLETRNIGFGNVFILGVNEGVLPATESSSLIPLKIRLHLNLSTKEERYKLTAYQFDLLIKRAKEVHLFFLDNSLEEKSRFIQQLLWGRQKQDQSIETKPYIKRINYRLEFGSRKPPCPINKTADIVSYLNSFSYSASLLDAYLKCPIKFYYRYVLGLKEKEELEGNIEAKDVGIFIHGVLREFFKVLTGQILRKEDLDVARMDKVVNDSFRNHFGENPVGAAYLLKEQARLRMREFLEKYQLPIINGQQVIIHSIEKRLGPQEINVNDEKAGNFTFKLEGRFDRIETREADGSKKTYILDYKTAGDYKNSAINFGRLDPDSRETWNKAIKSFQLPIYLLLYLSSSKEKCIHEVSPAYLFMGKNYLDDKIEVPLFKNVPSKKAIEDYENIKVVIFRLLKEITNIYSPFSPALELEKTCPKCEFRHICGTQWL